MKIRVRYFAQLRDEAGKAEEVLDTPAATPGELYLQLQKQYGFRLQPEVVRAAVDDEFQPWDFPLEAGALVVFIPPVAGG